MTTQHGPTGPQRTAARGFTLIELMIVVAIIAILAAVAYPIYIDSVRKGRRAEARTALVELLQQQERYMTQRNTYQPFNYGSSTTDFKTFAGSNASSASYSLQATKCDAPNDNIKDCVKVWAKPVSADPDAGEIWANSIGEKGCTGTKPGVCWK